MHVARITKKVSHISINLIGNKKYVNLNNYIAQGNYSLSHKNTYKREILQSEDLEHKARE